MSCYKIIRDGSIVDVNNTFLRWSEKHKAMIACTPEQGQFIQGRISQTIYRVDWLNKAPETITRQYEFADAKEISENEFNSILKILDTDGYTEQDNKAEQNNTQSTIVENAEIDSLRKLKITELSQASKYCIENGIDLVLSDGNVHHFDLTLEDQQELSSLASNAEQLMIMGLPGVPLHARDEQCEFFSVEDFKIISEAAFKFVIERRSYFNSLKGYVNTLQSAAEIAAIQYGMTIPAENQNAVLQVFSAGRTEVEG